MLLQVRLLLQFKLLPSLDVFFKLHSLILLYCSRNPTLQFNSNIKSSTLSKVASSIKTTFLFRLLQIKLIDSFSSIDQLLTSLGFLMKLALFISFFLHSCLYLSYWQCTSGSCWLKYFIFICQSLKLHKSQQVFPFWWWQTSFLCAFKKNHL